MSLTRLVNRSWVERHGRKGENERVQTVGTGRERTRVRARRSPRRDDFPVGTRALRARTQINVTPAVFYDASREITERVSRFSP